MKGDLLFLETPGYLFKKIRAIIKAPYDHVAIRISDTLAIEATPFHGVRIIEVKNYSGLQYAVCRFKNIDEDIIYKFLNFAQNQLGRKYDYWYIIGVYFTILFKGFKVPSLMDIRGSFICSELVAHAASAAGINMVSDDIDIITPSELFRSSTIYEVKDEPLS